MLVASVYLFDIVYAAGASGTHGSYQQGNTCTDIWTRHATSAKSDLPVVAYNNGTMRIAEDNLSSHIDEFVNKE